MSATVPHATSIVELRDVHVVHRTRGGGLFGRERVYALTGADLTVRARRDRRRRRRVRLRQVHAGQGAGGPAAADARARSPSPARTSGR